MLLAACGGGGDEETLVGYRIEPLRNVAGFTVEAIFNLTKIDRWFLVQMKEIVDVEEELARSVA